MNLGKTRSFLYRLARFLGDVNAVKKGRMGEAGRQRVIEQYAVERFRSSLLALWTRLLDER